MQYNEITAALADLARTSMILEETYIENEGEVTELTEALEAEKEALKALLTTEGIDSLGRWLKSKEDEKATYKAEKAAADRRIKSVDKTIAFIKQEIGRILRETGQQKVKGSFYSFSQLDSTTTSVDTEALDADYLELATEAARNAGLPGFIDVALKTTGSRIKEWAQNNEGEGSGYLDFETTETCTFTKPKKEKEA